MIVSIVTITTYDGGNVEVTTKPFFTFENASKHLYNEYLDIKRENEDEEYCNDEVEKVTESGAEYFFLQSNDLEYWVSGNIYSMEVE